MMTVHITTVMTIVDGHGLMDTQTAAGNGTNDQKVPPGAFTFDGSLRRRNRGHMIPDSARRRTATRIPTMTKTDDTTITSEELEWLMKRHQLSIPDVCRITSCLEDDVCRVLNGDRKTRAIVARRIGILMRDHDRENTPVWAPQGCWTAFQLKAWMDQWQISCRDAAEVMGCASIDVIRMRRGSEIVPSHFVDRAMLFTTDEKPTKKPKPAPFRSHLLCRYAGDDRKHLPRARTQATLESQHAQHPGGTA